MIRAGIGMRGCRECKTPVGPDQIFCSGSCRARHTNKKHAKLMERARKKGARINHLRAISNKTKARWAAEKEWGLRVTAQWQREQSLRLDGCYCSLCEQFHPWGWSTIDHIIEQARDPGKKHDPMNFQPVGLDCNGKKHYARGEGAAAYAKWAGDKRPATLKGVFERHAAGDWSGKRLRPKKEWSVPAAPWPAA